MTWPAGHPYQTKESGRARIARWRAAHPEEARKQTRESMARWRLSHPLAAAEESRRGWGKWKREHPEYVEINRSRQRLYMATYRASHPGASNGLSEMQRARKCHAPVVETVLRSKVFERDDGICHICLKPVDPHGWHMDHIVPLSRGGEHSYKNVGVSHPFCNLSKGPRIRKQASAVLTSATTSAMERADG